MKLKNPKIFVRGIGKLLQKIIRLLVVDLVAH